MLRNPLVGMPAQMDPGDNRQHLSCQYADAIASAGGIPIILPLLAIPETIRPLAESLDGILLTGNNSDVDPAHYSACRLDCCGLAQPLRDKMDFLLLEVAYQRKTPVLAICFGMQSLNVFLGGSLIQDIPSVFNTPIKHNNPNSGGPPCHEVWISSGSILETLGGGLSARVNSSHHQVVDRPGRDLEVIARSSDGLIESVSGKNRNHWILAVQWHPEKSFARDGFSRSIFEHFLARCRAVQEVHERADT